MQQVHARDFIRLYKYGADRGNFLLLSGVKGREKKGRKEGGKKGRVRSAHNSPHQSKTRIYLAMGLIFEYKICAQ
jgi:hypothetical protein